jgi:hypothetical protein
MFVLMWKKLNLLCKIELMTAEITCSNYLMLQSCRIMKLCMHPVANLPKYSDLSNDLSHCSLCSLD